MPASDARWWPTATAFLVNGTIFGIWVTQIPLVTDRLSLAPALLGLLLLALGLGAVAAMLASGWLIERHGSAAVVRAGGAGFCALLPLVTLAPDPVSLGLVLCLFGAAGGSMDVAMNAHAAEVERRSGRPGMSSFHGMWSLGGLVGAGLGGLALALVPGPVQALGAAVLLGLLLAVAQLHLLAAAPASAEARRSLRPDRATLALGSLMALCFLSEGAILDWSPLFLRNELGASTELAGVGFAAFSGAMALCRFLGDPMRRRVGGTAVMVAGAGLAVGGLLIAALGGSVALAVIGFCITGLGLSNLVPVLFSTAGASASPGVAIATTATMGYAGLLAGPPLLGFVAEATSIATAFLLIAAFCALVGAASLLLRR